jgi:hypothetical protein
VSGFGGGRATLRPEQHRAEADRTERLRFSVARSQGAPTEGEIVDLILNRAGGCANDRPASVQFREREVEHPEGSNRRVVFLQLPE